LKVVIVGLGIQGKKRLAIAGADAVATVDPCNQTAEDRPHYRALAEVPLSSYDAALVCTPDQAKIPLLRHLLTNGKHVLVEKPLLSGNAGDLTELAALANANRAVCYTAYNHRFEPHFIRMKQTFDAGTLGRIYAARIFYGNGTARDVRNSVWRDQGCGVLPDLGSHLLDTIAYWFGQVEGVCKPWRADRFENRSYDHFVFGFHGAGQNGDPLAIDCELSMLSWRNSFSADVYGEKGSAHISCLCKWGPSTFTLRGRVLPSGRPDEESTTLVCADPTWAAEYQHFNKLCADAKGSRSQEQSLSNDIWIQSKLQELAGGVPTEKANA
jgi:scyllo-inositol 2-dehydrogenase (NADP+)